MLTTSKIVNFHGLLLYMIWNSIFTFIFRHHGQMVKSGFAMVAMIRVKVVLYDLEGVVVLFI